MEPSPALEEIGDELLIEALAKGDAWAMEPLYRRYRRPLYRVAYRMVANEQVAEDLVQEAFLSVWRSANSYAPQTGSVRTWLHALMHHRTLNYLRSLRSQATWKQVSWEEAERLRSAAMPDVWDMVWSRLQKEQVQDCLMTLPPEQRSVIELAYFQGLTQTEIATQCRLPLGTAKSRLRLGLRRLRHELERWRSDPPPETRGVGRLD